MTHVLAIEDNEDIRDLISIRLSKAGFAVHMASSRDDALVIIRDGMIPDLILMDIMMPGCGIECFLTELRSITSKPVPIIFETCSPDGERQASQHNAYYLPKEFSAEDLLRTVKLCFSPRACMEAAV